MLILYTYVIVLSYTKDSVQPCIPIHINIPYVHFVHSRKIPFLVPEITVLYICVHSLCTFFIFPYIPFSAPQIPYISVQKKK